VGVCSTVNRFAGSIYGGVGDEPVGIIAKHRAILEWVEREFLGRKAVEARKKRYMPSHH